MTFKYLKGGVNGNSCGCDAHFPKVHTVLEDTVILCEHDFIWRPTHRADYSGDTNYMWCWITKEKYDILTAAERIKEEAKANPATVNQDNLQSIIV